MSKIKELSGGLIALAVIMLVMGLAGMLGSSFSQQPPQKAEPIFIEGVVEGVRYFAAGDAINPIHNVRLTIVDFEDGRVKTFNGIGYMIFHKGQNHVIEFDPDSHELLSVDIR